MLSRYHIDANWRLRLLNYFVNFKTDDVVLDAGCGDGFMASEIAKKVCRVVGTDVDAAIIELDRKCINRNNLKFICADLTNDRAIEEILEGPLHTGFTKVICLDALEHMGQPEGVMKNFARLLQPKGEVFITVPVDCGHGCDIDEKAIEESLKTNGMQIIFMKKIRAPMITASFKKAMEATQALLGYGAREVDSFSKTVSFELEVSNPPILKLYKLFFLLVIQPLTLLEGRPFREHGKHLVIVARKD